MADPTDPVQLLLGFLIIWWHGAGVASVLGSSKPAGSKLRWVLAILLLMPFGLATYLLMGREQGGQRRMSFTGYLTIAALGAGLLLGLTRDHWAGHEHLAWMGAWSIVTFVMYAYDKTASAAGKDERGSSKQARVNENALHLFALLGGFLGGWIGRHALRHKTKKVEFGVVLAASTALHLSKLFELW